MISMVALVYSEVILLHFSIRYIPAITSLIFAHTIASGQETPVCGSPVAQISRAQMNVYHVWKDKLGGLAKEYTMLSGLGVCTTLYVA